jgi:hypothetical protein
LRDIALDEASDALSDTADAVSDSADAGDARADAPPTAPVCARPPSFRGPLGPELALGIGNGQILRVVSDGDGRTIVAGHTWDHATIGERPSVDMASPGRRPFLLVLGADGREVWSRVYPGSSEFGAVAVSAAGEIYLVATGVEGPAGVRLDLGAGAIAGELFLVKLGRDGAVLWQRGFVAPGREGQRGSVTGFTLAVAPDGGVAFAGEVAATLDFGGGPGGNEAPETVVAFDRDGQHRFTRRGFYPRVSEAPLAFDSAGNLFATGTRSDGIPPLDPARARRGFLVKLDATGTTVWERELGRDAAGVALATTGTDVYVAGDFGGVLTVDPSGRAAVGTTDLFVARLGPDGGVKALHTRPVLWSRYTSVAAHPAGGVLVTGQASEVLDFAGGMVQAGDDFVAHLADDGTALASASFRDAMSFFATSAGTGHVALAGTFDEPIDLGTGPLPNVRRAGSRMFVGRLAPLPGAPIAPMPCATPSRFYTSEVVDQSAVPLVWGRGFPLALALTKDAVFYASWNDIHQVPRAGGAATVRAQGLRQLSGFHADEAGLVWTDTGTAARRDGNLMALPPTGGLPQTLAANLAKPRALVVDGDTLFFLTEGPLPEDKTELWALPRAGGTPRVVASGLLDPGPIAAHGSEVVLAFTAVSGGRALMHVRGNGDRSVIFDSGIQRRITAITFDGTTILFTQDDSIPFGGSGSGSSGDGRLLALPISGGAAPTVRAEPLPHPMAILRVGDEVMVPFSGVGGGGTTYGGVISVPAAGGASTFVLSRPYLRSFAADSLGIAWIEAPAGWTLYRRPR